MFRQEFLKRIFYEYRMLLLWILIAVMGFIFFVFMFNRTQPQVGPTVTPDPNVYY